MKAIWRGRVIAESKETREVGGYRVLSARIGAHGPSARDCETSSDLKCPHGVQFYDVGEDGACSARSAWSYEAPQPRMQQVDHWIGFWQDVTISDV